MYVRALICLWMHVYVKMYVKDYECVGVCESVGCV